MNRFVRVLAHLIIITAVVVSAMALSNSVANAGQNPCELREGYSQIQNGCGEGPEVVTHNMGHFTINNAAGTSYAALVCDTGTAFSGRILTNGNYVCPANGVAIFSQCGPYTQCKDL